ncbi:MAG: hypothetical protein ACR2IH_00550, partial [Pyrinomonadaceae bacterium]
FRGTVDGNSPFVAVLRMNGGDALEGVYAYLKYRKGIYLDGTLKDNEVELTEHVLTQTEMNFNTDSNHRYVEAGRFRGKLDSSGLNSFWTDKQKQKSMIFVAHRD